MVVLPGRWALGSTEVVATTALMFHALVARTAFYSKATLTPYSHLLPWKLWCEVQSGLLGLQGANDCTASVLRGFPSESACGLSCPVVTMCQEPCFAPG